VIRASLPFIIFLIQISHGLINKLPLFYTSFIKNKKAGDKRSPALGEEKLKEELYGGC